ncbi:Fic family protein [Aeromonas veronii]|uniref:Fic family protein n=1 Tax=Aeromonas veronii TaxID=654 RepID=UPI001FD6A793|nr:Fic family protein [Aeromonas veronii]MCJ8233187.1 Fic family protein [Aeromonas veronii]
MSKHIKITNVHSLEEFKAEDNIVHIKTTPSKNGFTHFYWNIHRSEIIVGSKVQFPVKSIAHLKKNHESFYDLSRSEIQIGDSVCYIANFMALPIFCATIIGTRIHNNQRFFFLRANHPQNILSYTWAKYIPERFFLVSNNKNERGRYIAPDNLMYARYQDELDKIEMIYSVYRSKMLIMDYMTSNSFLGEMAFLKCHKYLFNGIYDWAGKYRVDEVVVTNRNFPTENPDSVPQKMAEFCNSFARKYLAHVGSDQNKMIDALVFAHKELAWIHPFMDGNGRTMRLYLEIVARTRGFKISWQKALSTKKRKKFYHYAVRKAISGRTSFLKKIISQAIS